MKTTIETEAASVVILCRESYDLLQASKYGANVRANELANKRDRLINGFVEAERENPDRGYNVWFSAAEVVAKICKVFEVANPLEEKAETNTEPSADIEKGEE